MKCQDGSAPGFTNNTQKSETKQQSENGQRQQEERKRDNRKRDGGRETTPTTDKNKGRFYTTSRVKPNNRVKTDRNTNQQEEHKPTGRERKGTTDKNKARQKKGKNERLEAKVIFEILSNLTNQSLEWQFAQQEVR